jgi:hypothetical protein
MLYDCLVYASFRGPGLPFIMAAFSLSSSCTHHGILQVILFTIQSNDDMQLHKDSSLHFIHVHDLLIFGTILNPTSHPYQHIISMHGAYTNFNFQYQKGVTNISTIVHSTVHTVHSFFLEFHLRT